MVIASEELRASYYFEISTCNSVDMDEIFEARAYAIMIDSNGMFSFFFCERVKRKIERFYFPRTAVDRCFSILILRRLAVFRGNDRDEIFYLDFCIKRRLL